MKNSKNIDLDYRGEAIMYTAHILVCGGTGCLSQKSEKIIEEFNKEIKKQGITGCVKVVKTGCFGFCGAGPIVKILPDNTLYVYVKDGDAAEILSWRRWIPDRIKVGTN